MKKLLLSLVGVSALFLGTKAVNAANINIDDIDTNTYIVGERVYELNDYDFSIYDVVVAANEYSRNHSGAMAPIYFLGQNKDGSKYIDVILGAINDQGEVPTERKEVEEVFADMLMNATAINNSDLLDIIEDYIGLNVEPKIVAALSGLELPGFGEVTYDSETHTVTFKINDGARSLTSSVKGVTDAFKQFVASLDADVKITYNYEGETGDFRALVNGEDNSELRKLAKKVAEALEADDEFSLASLVGKTADVVVTFENEEVPTAEKFVVKFDFTEAVQVEQTIVDADARLEALADSLENHAGFGEVTYEDKKATLKVADTSKKVTEAAQYVMDALEAFVNDIPEGVDVTYTLNGHEYDVKNLTEEEVKTIAKTLLKEAGADKNYTLGSLVGKTLTATLTYSNGEVGESIDYTIEFKKTDAEVIDETKETVNDNLATTATSLKDADLGFSNVAYNEETKTMTFTQTPGEDIDFAKAKNELKSLYNSFVAGIDEDVTATYTLNGHEYDLKNISDADMKTIAKALLQEVGYPESDTLSGTLQLNINYGVKNGGTETVTYTVVFE